MPNKAHKSHGFANKESVKRDFFNDRQFNAVTHWQHVNVTIAIVRAYARPNGRYQINNAHEKKSGNIAG